LFYFFFHLSLNIGKSKSCVAFITTNYYPTATGGIKLRSDFKERTSISHLINLNELKIFESALGQHNMITILNKISNENAVSKNCITNRKGLATTDVLNEILSWNDLQTNYYNVKQKNIYEGEHNYIRIMGVNPDINLKNRILNKILRQSRKLKELCDVKVGLRTGIDRISNKHLKIKDGYKVGESVFVINKNEYERIPLRERSIVKPLYKNSDIHRWHNSDTTQYYIIYSKRNTPIKKYPYIYKHLLKYRKLIEAIRKSDGEIWYSIVRPREERIFSSPKIVAPQRSNENTFSYNEYDYYGSSDIYYIVQKKNINNISLKYVLALLNSSPYYIWLYEKGKRKGNSLELYQTPLSEIPIKEILPENQKPFVELVNNILKTTTSEDFVNNTKKLLKIRSYEKQIDQLVYKLYDLTPEEIGVVEEATKQEITWQRIKKQ